MRTASFDNRWAAFGKCSLRRVVEKPFQGIPPVYYLFQAIHHLMSSNVVIQVKSVAPPSIRFVAMQRPQWNVQAIGAARWREVDPILVNPCKSRNPWVETMSKPKLSCVHIMNAGISYLRKRSRIQFKHLKERLGVHH